MIETVPYVSVIMPIRNEAACIEHSLRAVVAQDYPLKRMEILIADGMSDDGTRDVIQCFTISNPQLAIHILDNPKRSVPTGLNLAIRQAKGDIIVRVDGHTLIAPDYISEGVATLIRTGADNVGGLMTPVGHGWIGKTIALAHNLRFGLGGGLFHRATKETEADTVYMGIFRREVFTTIGLFDEGLVRNQDIELNGRIRQAGGRIVLSPRICSTYFCRSSLYGLWKQNYANGIWLIPTVVKTAKALSWRHYVPLSFISAILASSIVSLIVSSGWIPLSIILGTYLLSCFILSATSASKYGWSFIFSLPIVFFILHFSYGIGSFISLIKNSIFLLNRIKKMEKYDKL
jgi:succinoglycan biosynthesis protein ExoA